MHNVLLLHDYLTGAGSALAVKLQLACHPGISFASILLPADFLALALCLPIDSASFDLLIASQPCTVAWAVLWLATTCIQFGTNC